MKNYSREEPLLVYVLKNKKSHLTIGDFVTLHDLHHGDR
tara:strand:+ start:1539 stop:1655 length:117 start_codon:yes stop_codon:yes gene_type:complete